MTTAATAVRPCVHEWVDCELYGGDERRQRCALCKLERTWPPTIARIPGDKPGDILVAVNPFEKEE